MAIRIGRSAEADRYAPGGRNYRGPIFGQQQPRLVTSIPTGGFMGQNQIGGQSGINVFRTPLTPSQQRNKEFRDRAKPATDSSGVGKTWTVDSGAISGTESATITFKFYTYNKPP